MRIAIKLLSVTLAFVLTLGIVSPAVLYAKDVNITIYDRPLVFSYKDHPTIVNGTLFIPVRTVFENLGFDVGWDDDTKTVILSKTDYVVTVTIGSGIFTQNGASRALDTPARIIDGRIMLSVRSLESVLESVGQHWNYASWDISWAFSVYAEPDFKAKRIASFSPQTIDIIYVNDGWALTNNIYGDCWVYLNANLRYIDKTMGIYEHKKDALPIYTIDPQLVTILEQDGSWLQIETWIGPKWIDLNFIPPIKPLAQLSVSKANSQAAADYINNKINTLIDGSGTAHDRAWQTLNEGKSVVMFFEGAGASLNDNNLNTSYPNSGYRYGALCVVIKKSSDGKAKIMYESNVASTLPSYLYKGWNSNKNVPTVIDGIYTITAKYHKGSMRAVNISNANVARWNEAAKAYDRNGETVSLLCNIHASRFSTGCFQIGRSYSENDAEYAGFIKVIGATAAACRSGVDLGIVIVDRKFDTDYLLKRYSGNQDMVRMIQGM